MKIALDDQFPPSYKNVAEILRHYNLKLVTYEEASTGIENRTLIVDTTNGRFVIRVYRLEKKQLHAIQLELDFVEYLRSHNIEIPRTIPSTTGKQITTLQLENKTWQIIVMAFADGEHAKNYTSKLLLEMSAIQARMHILSDSYEGSLASAQQLTMLQENYFTAQISRRLVQDDRLRSFLKRAQTYTLELPSELPRGFCHLDYDMDNLSTKDDSIVAVLDFDDLAAAPFVVCLAYTLWHIHVHDGDKAEHRYLNHYETRRTLTHLERKYIKPIMLFRHYVICALKVLNNHVSSDEITEYLRIEANLS
jgi:Ser/Thr protein kinase RdoA (MazF antagonist)